MSIETGHRRLWRKARHDDLGAAAENTDDSQGNQGNRTLCIAITTTALLFVLLLFPDHPASFNLQHFSTLPLEWPLITLALLVAGGIFSLLLRFLIVLLLGVTLLLRLADIGSRLAFDRPFSPLVEWHLLGDGWNLASQQVGRFEAGLFVLTAVALLVGLVYSLFSGLGAINRVRGVSRLILGGIASSMLVVGFLGLYLQSRTPDSKAWVQMDLVPELINRSQDLQRSVADQKIFVADLLLDPVSAEEPPTFAALTGLDVAFVFVESYGRSYLVDEDFGPVAASRLASIERDISAAGLHARSGWLTSPVRGGRSWLTHASFASGLEINNQARFDRLVASQRVSLYSLFARAGWQTAGLVPAIREAWPEGKWYGFDRIYDREGMNYKGMDFGWVTMPDQYTLSFFENDVRQSSERPVMAEIALISSHAPWTPIPSLVPWEIVGDGSVFDGSHRFGEPMTWSNRALVREMYAKSVDYSLATVGEYLSRHGSGALFVIHGDHQPASIIAGWGKTADVPIHIVSDDPSLLERLPADVFTDGMLPSDSSRSLPMWSMRELMSRVFESTEDEMGSVSPLLQ